MASLLWTLAALAAVPTTVLGGGQTLNRIALAQPVVPQFDPKAATWVANLNSSNYNRDSCTSVRVADRQFWTCRDSYVYATGAVLTSSAGWSTFNADGTPAIVSMGGNGPGYYPIDTASVGTYFLPGVDQCLHSPDGLPPGYCGNGERWAMWPDSPPLPVPQPDGSYRLYTYIPLVHFVNQTTTSTGSNPAIALYRSDWNSGMEGYTLPSVNLLNSQFFPSGTASFGALGWLAGAIDGHVYLYGAAADSSGAVTGVHLAKVPAASIEDASAYTYWTGTSWSSTAPAVTDTSAVVPNAGTGGQGTYYYSSHFNKYIWIGMPRGSASISAYIATADNPEGPWTESQLLFTSACDVQAPCGEYAYSVQAHPGLSRDQGNGNDIYVSLTYQFADLPYTNRLYHVEFTN